MNHIVIDRILEPFFGSIHAPTEIRHRLGHVLGVFTPRSAPAVDFDLEEAERTLERERHQGKTLEEVKRYLRSLAAVFGQWGTFALSSDDEMTRESNMGVFMAEPELATVFSQMKERTEIRDPEGKVLGFFTPQGIADEGMWTSADLEEAERALAEERDTARPLKEIWRDLRSRETSA